MEAATAAQSAAWDAPAEIWALLAEVHRDREKRRQPFTPFDVHPFRDAPKEKGLPISQLVKELRGGGN